MNVVENSGDKLDNDVAYLQHNSRILGELEDDQPCDTSRPFYNRNNRTNRITTDHKQDLSFILSHFESMEFPAKFPQRQLKDGRY